MLCLLAVRSTATAYTTDFEGWVTSDPDTMLEWSRVGTVANVGITTGLGINPSDVSSHINDL